MIIKLKSPKDKWTLYVGQMESSELKFLRTIGNILLTFDLLFSDNYQDSRGGGRGGVYMIVLTGSDGTIRDNLLVENWEYSPHIHHVGGDNYQDFRGGVGFI